MYRRVHVGDKFGRLTVTKIGLRRKTKSGRMVTKVECVCSCPNHTVKEYLANQLNCGDIVSCGCYIREVLNEKAQRRRKAAEIAKGTRFGRLITTGRKRITRQTKYGSNYEYECICDCGKTTWVCDWNLKIGMTRSCGCLTHEHAHNYLGGICDSKLHGVWRAMKARCNNPNSCAYRYYGARGIEVCEEWSKSYKDFYEWAINNGYKEGLTIDRIDVNGNYCPENCRWATRAEQMDNTTRSIKVMYNGEEMTVVGLSRVTGIAYENLRRKIRDEGMTAEEAVSRTKERKIKK